MINQHLLLNVLMAIVFERKKPNNLGAFKTKIGEVECIKDGNDITIVSYGSTLRIVEVAARELAEVGIDAEVIDVQSLIPLI